MLGVWAVEVTDPYQAATLPRRQLLFDELSVANEVGMKNDDNRAFLTTAGGDDDGTASYLAEREVQMPQLLSMQQEAEGGGSDSAERARLQTQLAEMEAVLLDLRVVVPKAEENVQLHLRVAETKKW